MIETNFRSAAVAAVALAAAFAAAPAFAREMIVEPAGEGVVSAEPAVEAEAVAVPPNAIGHFTCAFNEAHTRLERQNCGGSHYRYGF